MSEVPERKWAGAYLTDDFICIDTFSGYRGSARDPNGAHHLLRTEVSDVELGTAVRNALDLSRFLSLAEIPEFFDYEQIGRRYKQWSDELINKFGYKSKRALFQKMSSCRIEERGGKIAFKPTDHEKLEGWSEKDPSDAVIIPSNSGTADMGAALRLAFSRCT